MVESVDSMGRARRHWVQADMGTKEAKTMQVQNLHVEAQNVKRRSLPVDSPSFAHPALNPSGLSCGFGHGPALLK